MEDGRDIIQAHLNYEGRNLSSEASSNEKTASHNPGDGEELGEAISDGDSGDIIYLGMTNRDEDEVRFLGMKTPEVMYWRTHLPSEEMTVQGTNIRYSIYYSSHVRPAADIGEVGDLFILKDVLKVFWKKEKRSGNVAWKEARANELVLHPAYGGLSLQAGRSTPRWHSVYYPDEPDRDFARAAKAFLKTYEQGNTQGNPITLDL